MNQTTIFFRFRPFISFVTTFSFLALAVTGVILFVTPPGRIANWTNWTFWGLTRHQWVALHICTSTLFVIASLFHLYLNLKPLINYLVSKTQQAVKLHLEWAAAVILCGVVVWGALKPFEPFSSLLNLNSRAKNRWAAKTQQPPVPHAEILTIAELADQAEMEIEIFIANLSRHGIQAAAEDIFGDIADKAAYSPEELFRIAVGQADMRGRGRQHGGGMGGFDKQPGDGPAGGFGQLTLAQACQDMSISVEDAMKALNAAGIQAAADQRIRDIADKNNIHPSQIRRILEGN